MRKEVCQLTTLRRRAYWHGGISCVAFAELLVECRILRTLFLSILIDYLPDRMFNRIN